MPAYAKESLKLLEAEEFGDWLLGEFALQEAAMDAFVDASRQDRMQALEDATSVFLEFLLLRQSMMAAAQRSQSA